VARRKATGKATTGRVERTFSGPERKPADAGRYPLFDRPPANSNASPEMDAVRNAGTQGTQNPHSPEVGATGREAAERTAILPTAEARSSTPFAIIGSPAPANDTGDHHSRDGAPFADWEANPLLAAIGPMPAATRRQFIDALVDLIVADLAKRPP
jgi:hypothetical protein